MCMCAVCVCAVCVRVCVWCATAHVPEDNLWESVLSYYQVGAEIKLRSFDLRSPGLAAGTFSHRASPRYLIIPEFSSFRGAYPPSMALFSFCEQVCVSAGDDYRTGCFIVSVSTNPASVATLNSLLSLLSSSENKKSQDGRSLHSRRQQKLCTAGTGRTLGNCHHHEKGKPGPSSNTLICFATGRQRKKRKEKNKQKSNRKVGGEQRGRDVGGG